MSASRPAGSPPREPPPGEHGAALVVFDAAGTVIMANGAAERLLEAAPGSLLGTTGPSARPALRRDGSPLGPGESPVEQVRATGVPVVGQVLGLPGTGGTVTWVLASAAPLPAPALRGEGVVVSLVDLTTLDGPAAGSDADRVRSTFEHAPVGMALSDAEGIYREVNPAFCQLVGRSADEVIGRSVAAVVHPDDAAVAEDYHQRLIRQEITGYQLELRYVRPDGRWVWARLVSGSPPPDERGQRHAICQIVDITEMKGMAERLNHAATHDPLTGLPNRALLFDRLDMLLRRRSRHPGMIAALFVDLDGFKPVNDTHGHAVGDQVLIQAARRIQAAVRPGDTVSRFGGDEFVVLCDDLAGAGHAIAVAERVVGVFDQRIVVDGTAFAVGASVGLVLVEADAEVDGQALVQAADAALYRAKDAGGRCVAVGTLGEGMAAVTSAPPAAPAWPPPIP